MKESRFSEQQIVGILKEAEVGVAVRVMHEGAGLSVARAYQNAFIERFNRSYRDEVLNAYVFCDLDEVRQITREWLRSYNEERPHDALGSLPPALYREQLTAKNSTTELAI